MSTAKKVGIGIAVVGVVGVAYLLLRPETSAEMAERAAAERAQSGGPLIFSMPVIVNVGGRYLVLPTSGG